MTRREFLKTSTVSGSSLAILGVSRARTAAANATAPLTARPADPRARLPDLSPAKWIWYPSGRTLQNTFILFRRDLNLPARPHRATGWIAADSRYRLEVNGQRMQWGPGDRASSNAGTCARCRKSSTRGSIRTAGASPTSRSRKTGWRRCRCPVPRTNPRSSPATTSTCSISVAGLRTPNSGPAAFPCCASRSCRCRSSRSRSGWNGSVRRRNTSSSVRQRRSRKSASRALPKPRQACGR